MDELSAYSYQRKRLMPFFKPSKYFLLFKMMTKCAPADKNKKLATKNPKGNWNKSLLVVSKEAVATLKVW